MCRINTCTQKSFHFKLVVEKLKEQRVTPIQNLAGKSQEQRVNLLFTCNSSQMTFLPQFSSNKRQSLPADFLKFLGS